MKDSEMGDCYYKVIILPHLSFTLYPVPLFLCSPTDVNALSQTFQGQLSCTFHCGEGVYIPCDAGTF